MATTQQIEPFDWKRIFLPEHFPIEFLAEVGIRTAIMFMALLIVLRFSGKRSLQQLTVFELAILIGLGSAAGDPMFYEDVAILTCLVVFAVVMLLYKSLTFLSSKSQKLEDFMEGKPSCVLRDGEMIIKSFKKDTIDHDTFYSQLRNNQVDHLGQVRLAYIETSGKLSIYFYEDKDVKPGLPLLPEVLNAATVTVPEEDDYACVSCGHIQHQKKGKHPCNVCHKSRWLKPWKNKRIS